MTSNLTRFNSNQLVHSMISTQMYTKDTFFHTKELGPNSNEVVISTEHTRTLQARLILYSVFTRSQYVCHVLHKLTRIVYKDVQMRQFYQSANLYRQCRKLFIILVTLNAHVRLDCHHAQAKEEKQEGSREERQESQFTDFGNRCRCRFTFTHSNTYRRSNRTLRRAQVTLTFPHPNLMQRREANKVM